VLRAPADGIVTAVGASVGDRPAVGASLAVIAPANGARAVLGVEPGEARLVHAGDRVKLRPAQAGARERSGRVAVVGAAIDKETRLVSVSVALDQAGFEDYLAGVTVEGSIETRAIDAFSVPRSAVIKDDEGAAVFEVAGGKAHRVAVVVEVDEGQRIGVSGALDRTRPIVTTGAYELADGVAVAEQKP
jgi:multidrug efflux pump subunit AcrA (membrane-fusion protein)